MRRTIVLALALLLVLIAAGAAFALPLPDEPGDRAHINQVRICHFPGHSGFFEKSGTPVDDYALGSAGSAAYVCEHILGGRVLHVSEKALRGHKIDT